MGFFFFLALLLTVIDFVAFDENLFRSSYRKENTMEVMGMSEEDLLKASHVLLDYIKGKRENILIKAKVNGQEREVFDERESKHMLDVKKLYEKAMLVRHGSIIFLLGLFLYEFLKHKDGIRSFLWESFCYGGLCFGSLIVVIVLYAITDFYNFWMNFHYLFFDNDLFLLDPNVSLMINMFPESFFYSMVMRIILIFGLLSLLFGGMLYYSFYRLRRKLI